MKTIIEKIKSLSKGTIIRSILLITSYINQIIAVVGMTTFAYHPAYQITSLIVTIIISATAAWKNNDFTHMAQLAGKVLTALKDKKLDEEEVKNLLETATSNIEDKN